MCFFLFNIFSFLSSLLDTIHQISHLISFLPYPPIVMLLCAEFDNSFDLPCFLLSSTSLPCRRRNRRIAIVWLAETFTIFFSSLFSCYVMWNGKLNIVGYIYVDTFRRESRYCSSSLSSLSNVAAAAADVDCHSRVESQRRAWELIAELEERKKEWKNETK